MSTSKNVSDGAGSQRSEAVGVANAGTAGHSMDDGTGNAVITGAVLSVTLIV